MKVWLCIVAVLLVVGCGTAPPPATPAAATPAGFNEIDVLFAQLLARHQANAAKYLEVLEERATTHELRTLGAAIKVTEADEAELVRGWLESWDQPIEVDGASEESTAYGGLPSNGAAELEAMLAASDAEFEQTFLNIFIGHQHQAVDFARMEISGGRDPEAVSLAHRVSQSRQAQIEMMLGMVG